MSSDDAALFDNLAGELLEALGYEPSGRFSGERRALRRLRDEGERR